MTRRRRAAVGLVGVVLACTGCARLVSRHRQLPAADPAAVIAAGAARERAQPGLRITMSVRATGAALASPAYLAIDAPERLRLQVLSPFGVTVLAVAIDGDTYTLSLPLQHETRNGRIDLAALTAGTTTDDDRMIVALALLFRPKMRADRCRGSAPAAVTCRVTGELTAVVDVDEALRPRRETYVGKDGGVLLVADLADYPGPERDTLPGRIEIGDGQGGPALVVRVVRWRREAPAE